MQVKRSIHYRADRKKWRAVYWVPLTNKPISQSFDKKGDAAVWLDAEIAALLTGSWIDPAKATMRFGEFAKRHYWPNYSNRAGTYKTQEGIYRLHVEPRWGAVELDKVAKIDIIGWITELRRKQKSNGEPYSPSWVRQTYFMFHTIVGLAVEGEFLARNPCPKEPKLPEDPPATKVFALEPWEVERLAVTLEAHATTNPGRYTKRSTVPDWPFMFHTMVYAYCYGGFRPSEGLALRVNDLKVERSVVIVDEQVLKSGDFETYGGGPDTGALKTLHSYRAVPVARKVMDLLVAHVERNIGWDRPNALLFTNKLGWAFDLGNFRTRWFKPAAVEIGRDGMTPHDMRHTAASAWFDEGYRIEDVAEFLGDTVAVVRQTYLHMYQGRRDVAQDRMDQRFERGKAGNVTPIRRSAG